MVRKDSALCGFIELKLQSLLVYWWLKPLVDEAISPQSWGRLFTRGHMLWTNKNKCTLVKKIIYFRRNFRTISNTAKYTLFKREISRGLSSRLRVGKRGGAALVL